MINESAEGEKRTGAIAPLLHLPLNRDDFGF